MSSIWHTADEIPDFDKSYVELSRSLQGDLVYSTWGHPNYITPNTIKWCYMDDLLALETKLERTRKALDVAVDALKEYADRDNWGMGFAPWSEDGTRDALYTEDGYKTAEQALEQITALEQKDVK